MLTPGPEALFPSLAASGVDRDRLAIRSAGEGLTYGELASAAAATAATLDGLDRVAVVATPDVSTVVAIVGALVAGAALIPVNPAAGSRELDHMIADSDPEAVLASPDSEVGKALAALPRLDPATPGAALSEPLEREMDPERTAIIMYTSGTTGLPKGVLIPRRAVASNLDALADAWDWTWTDRLAHALPLYHVHGLVLGMLGPIRIGGQVLHVGKFSPEAIAKALTEGATMVFGVPTMYHRLADAAEEDSSIATALAGARLLVSGSAALPAVEHKRLERLCGQRVVERYGMTETLMNCSVCHDGDRRAGYVGLPLPGVELRLVDDYGRVLEVFDDETFGEIHIRGRNLFTGYLNQPQATNDSFVDGWFRTGDLATRAADGYIRIVGRRSSDLIKTAGYRIGAGEVEGALLEHPQVAEVAVAGIPDSDLGERIAAWVVPRGGATPSESELARHVGSLLSSHKRPRAFYFVDELPRNAMGKVMKTQLQVPSPPDG